MKTMRPHRRSFWAVLAVVLSLGAEAGAIIGPAPGAGPGRRTVRRAVVVSEVARDAEDAERANAEAQAAAAQQAAAEREAAAARQPGPVAVSQLPPNCTVGVPCGGVIYQPVYQGTNIVYLPTK